MNQHTRNDILVDVFKHLTDNTEYFLGFKYDPMTQKGSCDCANTGFKRFPVLKVKHNKDKSFIYFKSHHGDIERVSVVADSEFYFNALNAIKDKLEPHAGDWNDSQVNPFHPNYREGGDPLPEEG